jgi:hypothetical protein
MYTIEQFYTFLCFYACEHKFLYIVGVVLCCFYAATNLLFIHWTTNFYAISAPKTFKRILTTDSINSIVHHVLFFKFQIFKKTKLSPCFTCVVSMFYVLFSCQLYILILGSMMLVEAITVVLGGMSISWRGLYVATKLIFIHSTTNLYATWHQKSLYASWPLILCI